MLNGRRAFWVLLLSTCPSVRLSAWQCPDGAPPPCGRTSARAAPAPPANSVAVLYFENLSRDTSDAYVADGLTEEITSRLGQVSRLTVTSRTSVRRLRESAATMSPSDLGRALNVAYLVNGTVRRAGPRLRVTVELLRASTGVQAWSSQFDRTAEDLLSIQDEIALAVAAGITGQLLPAEQARLQKRPTTNAEAYDLYLRGMHAFDAVSNEALQEAIASFEAALRLDPLFTAARARAAYAYGWALNWDFSVAGVPPESLIARGLALADRALREDSVSAEAWAARGFLLFFRDPPDYREALASLQRGIALDSTSGLNHNMYATILRRTGDLDASEAELRRAIRLPGASLAQSQADLGFVMLMRRRYPEAAAWYDSAVAKGPEVVSFRSLRARARIQSGDSAGAREDADAAVRFSRAATRFRAVVTRVYVEASLGNVAAAREQLSSVGPILAPPGQPVSVRIAWDLASAWRAVGDADQAMDVLERARPRSPWLWSYLVMKEFDALRGDPRFRRLYGEIRPAMAPPLPFER